MQEHLEFYIDGGWTAAATAQKLDVIDPSTEEPFARIALGGQDDVDRAVAAAKAAFPAFAATSKEQRLDLLSKVLDGYKARIDEMAEAISREMGAPLGFSKQAQAPAGIGHLMQAIKALKAFEADEIRGTSLVTREPVGVVGFITPWNWPVNQMMCKIAPALAAGCTMVLKPSEIAPTSALLLAQILHDAGVPKGVFNLVNGDGPTVGQALATHPDIDMISFTGSTRAGIEVAKAAADTVKRVHQELGGKSALILLDDADFPKAVKGGARGVFFNSGQSCNALTRMLVPLDRMDEVAQIAKETAEKTTVGDPFGENSMVGPVVSKTQFDKIQGLIETGIKEGADLVAGGTGRPEGLNRGYYVRPTVFSKVTRDMTIAREEIFGPVLSIMGYRDEADAIDIANDSRYGLSGGVTSASLDRARAVARQLRTGTVHLNGALPDFGAAFGGYKQSGNGREWGRYGFDEFLEIKSVFGWEPPPAK
ncbi:aldehyde dehydrogenase family protein [Marinibaculum pumilum]|uniref:aldehyde dehydrogenase (NAD(+)) n=1 Tax=Marinibaculum pumilum TaxID=1766165 RepID=A0ABV7L5W4_9PROT